ncbi:MAG: neutral zinc metallopeptidase [Ardenticatenaceae bacterium]|nr:neutral zinc metallopeptidase [Ardenticatenaceae bacterium]
MQQLNQMSWIGRRRLLFGSVLLLGLSGLIAFVSVAAAAETAACSAVIGGELISGGAAEFEPCAQAVAAEGDIYSDDYQIGKWGRYTVVIVEQKSIFYRLGWRSRFSYWGDLASNQKQPVDEGDQEQGISEDRCPNEPETYNGVFDGDGCPDSIDDLLNFAISDLNAYWSTVTEELDYVYYPPRAVRAYSDPADPGLRYNAFYSPYGHYIAYDINLMERSLAEFGDFAPVAIMAHEWAHLAQRNLGVERDFTISTELQADCLAGAYTADLDQRGNLEDGDLEEGLYQMYTIGDPAQTPWFHPNAHGSGEQRYDAFLAGFEEGVIHCFETY